LDCVKESVNDSNDIFHEITLESSSESKIYGNILDNSDCIIEFKNYELIKSIREKDIQFEQENYLKNNMKSEEIISNKEYSLLEITVKYENRDNKSLFLSFKIKGTNKYINVTNPHEDNYQKKDRENEVYTIISDKKCIFSIGYSDIDNKGRKNIFSGASYLLKTKIGDIEYDVIWKIGNSKKIKAIQFIPTTWYELEDDREIYESQTNFSICKINNGIDILMDKLKKQFKGFTTDLWCNSMAKTSYCKNNENCGECFGKCIKSDEICYPDYDKGNKFICKSPENNDLSTYDNIVTVGTTASIIAFMCIVIITILLILGLKS